MAFIFSVTFTKTVYTGVKQCKFQWLISYDIAQKEMVFNSLIIHHCNTDYSGLEWSNINTFWYWYGKYISIADAGNHK